MSGIYNNAQLLKKRLNQSGVTALEILLIVKA